MHVFLQIMNDITFHHSIPIQLRFNDFDVLGHVNNSVYFTFYDLGKTDYFYRVLPTLSATYEPGVVIASINVSFQLPVFPGEKVEVLTKVTEIGEKSFKLLQHLVDTDTREVKCVCTTVMVGYNSLSKSSCKIPYEWRKAFADFEACPALAMESTTKSHYETV